MFAQAVRGRRVNDNAPKVTRRRLQLMKQKHGTVMEDYFSATYMIYCPNRPSGALCCGVVFGFVVDLPTAACTSAPMYPSSLLLASTLSYYYPSHCLQAELY
jgi:hypothetical protein